MVRWIKIREYERGLLYRDGVFREVLRPGRRWVFDPWLRARVVRVSVREVFLESPDVDVIARSGALGDEAVVLDLSDRERGLVWVDGRFRRIAGPGVTIVWQAFSAVRTEVVRVEPVRFEQEDLSAILATPGVDRDLESIEVEAGTVGLFVVDGRLVETLQPGRYAAWRGVARVRVVTVDLRESTLDVTGQEIMTADKVTLRLNAAVTYRVADPVRAFDAVASPEQALYRDAQMALRAAIGSRDLDAVLSDKEGVATELEAAIRERATDYGIAVVGLGIRDVILPGDMRTILNRVVEAQKAAEADLITRREETASMRSQANTARVFASNPVLMRLRELEVLEKVADKADLTVVLGDGGLADRVTKLV
ncbi:MAG: slipin family protein [Thermoanaerobaculia bacterium]